MCQFEDVAMPMRKVELVCPKCQANLLKEKSINNVRTGVQKKTLTFNRERNWFDWKEDEFETDGSFDEYRCAKCDTEVSEDIKNYL